MDKPDKVDVLAERLAAIMKVLIEHRDEKAALVKEDDGVRTMPVSVGDLRDKLKMQQALSPEDLLRHDIKKMMRDPVEHLLKNKAHSIGKAACEIGKAPTMRAVHDRACELLEEGGGGRCVTSASRFVDASWDGIGNCWWS